MLQQIGKFFTIPHFHRYTFYIQILMSACLPARRYASADTIAMTLCLSVSQSVCHKSLFCRNRWTNRADWWLLESRKVNAQSVINWTVVGQLIWEYLQTPTLDRCSLSQWSSSSVYSTIPLRGSVSDNWYLSITTSYHWTIENVNTIAQSCNYIIKAVLSASQFHHRVLSLCNKQHFIEVNVR